MTGSPQQATIPAICPHCEKTVAATVAGRVEETLAVLELVGCPLCEEGFLLMSEYYHPEWSERFQVWPARGRLLSDQVPAALRAEHEEARRCLEARSHTAAVVMVRRTLEGVCHDHGITETPLARALERMKERGLIDGRLEEWARALRVLGNEAAHYTGSSLTREDAVDALELAEALLDYVYVLTARFAAFQKRRNQPPDSVST